MRREHNAASSGGGDEDLYKYLPLNGDFIDRTNGADESLYFDSITVYAWHSDPADSSRQCLMYSGNGYNVHLPFFYRKVNESTLNYLTPAYTPQFTQAKKYLPLLGKTVEFWWYPTSQSGKVYILEGCDSLISQATSGLYGYDLYRYGTALYIYAKGRLNNVDKRQQYTLGSFTNGQWYRITLSYKDNGDSTYTATYKMYNASSTLLLNSDTLGLPPAPHGENNSIVTNSRSPCFFTSHYSYHGAGVNKYDYLKEFKIYNDLL